MILKLNNNNISIKIKVKKYYFVNKINNEYKYWLVLKKKKNTYKIHKSYICNNSFVYNGYIFMDCNSFKQI